MLKIRAQVSSKNLHVYPTFVLPFFNSPSFTLCCWAERWREVFLLWTRKCCFRYTDSLSHLELLSGITRMPLTWLPFTCPFVQYYLGKITVKWQQRMRVTLLALFGNKHSLRDVWVFSFPLKQFISATGFKAWYFTNYRNQHHQKCKSGNELHQSAFPPKKTCLVTTMLHYWV